MRRAEKRLCSYIVSKWVQWLSGLEIDRAGILRKKCVTTRSFLLVISPFEGLSWIPHRHLSIARAWHLRGSTQESHDVLTVPLS